MKDNVNRFVWVFLVLSVAWVGFSAIELKLDFDAKRTVVEIIVVGCVSALIVYLFPVPKKDRNIIQD
jgi:hypothetical protein